MCAFFRNIRTKAQLLGTKVWPPTDFVPMMYTFFDLISMVFNTVDRCQNCHEPDHPGTCPYFPTTVEPDPAFAGTAAPPKGVAENRARVVPDATRRHAALPFARARTQHWAPPALAAAAEARAAAAPLDAAPSTVQTGQTMPQPAQRLQVFALTS